MICPRCGNRDPSWFYLGSKGWYCRRCVRFRRVLAYGDLAASELPESGGDPEYRLRFELTAAQQRASAAIAAAARAGNSVLVRAVTGAGKTELVYEALREALAAGKRAAVAISRRQVVLQLAQRIREDFPGLKVVPVCQGYTQDVSGDLVICTAHQLYRYPRQFDLLVIDEPDAYPYAGDPVLPGIAESACRGVRIYLTATPDEGLRKELREGRLQLVELDCRPSGKPLALPRVSCHLPGLLPLVLVWELRKRVRQALVFFPTIRQAERYAAILRRCWPIDALTSRSPDKEAVIEAFKGKRLRFLFCTTVLERGVTFPGIDVIVYQAQHRVFTEASLIQIAGRVGRDARDPTGEGVFICSERAKAVNGCRREIERANRAVYGAERN